MAKVVLLCLVILLSSFSCIEASDFAQLHIIPWGERGGELKAELTVAQRQPFYRGPTSVRVDKSGKIWILNTLGGSLEVFSPKWELENSYAFPTFNKYDAEITCVDFAFMPSGDLALLELNDRTILLIGSDGKVKGQIPIPFKGGGPIFLGGIECDAKGRLYVTNNFDNSVLRFSLDGKVDGAVVSNIASNLVMDEDGAFYGTSAPRKDSFRHFQIVRELPFTKEQKVLVELEWDEGLAYLALVGRDGRGNLYLESATGSPEHPAARKVSVYSPKGKFIWSTMVPAPPMGIVMVRARAVDPRGGFYCARAKRAGFGLQSFVAPMIE